MTIHAKVAGTINMLLAEDGARLETGDKILLMESMKMTFEVYAPVSGILKLCCQLGQVVNRNQIIAEIN